MKKTTLIFATMIAAMVTLTACGGNKAETTGKENRNQEITEEREDSKTEKTKEDKNSKIKTVSEDEIVVRVGDVEIPITSTWGDLMTIASEQGWAIDTSLIPDEEAQKFSKKGTIQTPQGELLVSLMANADRMFDRELVALFMEYVAPYPLGVQVELSTGQKALVVRNNRSMLSRPMVRLDGGATIDLVERLDITITKILTDLNM